jgi:hypothetical protein
MLLSSVATPASALPLPMRKRDLLDIQNAVVSPSIRAATPRIKRSKLGAVCDLVEGMTGSQQHENDVAEVVIVCEPEAASLMMGGLHPRGSLYERPVNIEVAQAQHAEFREQVGANT